MEQGLTFLADIAVIMVVAGAVTSLFHWLRQPVVLGYLLAGILLGPLGPAVPLVRDLETVRSLADLGVILLLFSVGLEFPLRRLRRIGAVGFIVGAFKILLVWALGYQVGVLLGFSAVEAVFAGALLSITSTAVVVKALREAGLAGSEEAQVLYALMVAEDFFAVAMIAVLAGLSGGGVPSFEEVLFLLGKLALLAGVAAVLGMRIVPRAVHLLVRLHTPETLLVATLGMCFGMALLSGWLGLSPATGAFLMGALLGESEHRERLNRLMAPLRDMFAALFFVSVGMLMDLRVLGANLGPVLAFGGLALLAKPLGAGVGTLLAGRGGRTAFRVAMAVPAVGEFSFVIAKVGVEGGLARPTLYAVAMGSALITVLATPYLMGGAGRLEEWTGRLTPRFVGNYLAYLGYWLGELAQGARRSGPVARAVRDLVRSLALNLAAVGLLMVAGRLALEGLEGMPLPEPLAGLPRRAVATLIPLLVVLFALPFGLAMVQAVRRFAEVSALVLAEERPMVQRAWQRVIRRLLAQGLYTVLGVVVTLEALPLLIAFVEVWRLPPFLPVLALVALALAFWRVARGLQRELERAFRAEEVGPREEVPAGAGREEAL